jgi:hypothetical protein
MKNDNKTTRYHDVLCAAASAAGGNLPHEDIARAAFEVALEKYLEREKISRTRKAGMVVATKPG